MQQATKASDWRQLALLLILSAVFLLPVLLHPKALIYPTYAAHSDLATIHWPKATLQAGSVRQHGQWPLWTPRILSGMPLAANPLAMSFYPPSLLFLVLPVGLAFNLLWAFHFWLAGAGTYLWLRRAVGVSVPAAMLGALAFAFTGKMAAHTAAGHVSLIGAAAWLPWALYFADQAVTQRSVPAALLAGATLALQATTHSQIFLYTAYLVLTYGLTAVFWTSRSLVPGPKPSALGPEDQGDQGLAALPPASHVLSPLSLGQRTRGLSKGRNAQRGAMLLLIIFVAAGLLGAVQLLPLVEMAPYSNRAFIAGEASAQALTPTQLLVGLLLPTGQGGHEPVIYLGLTPLLLFPFAWARRRQWRVIFFAGLALFALLFALGDATPLYPLLRRLPGLSYTRTPARAGFLLALAVATLAAAGFDALISGTWTDAIRRRWHLAALGIVATGVTTGLGLVLITGTVSRATWGLALFPTLGVAAISAARRFAPQRPLILAAGLGALLLADLWSFDRTLWRVVSPEEALAPGPALSKAEGAEVAAWLAAQPGRFRVYSPGYAIEQQVAAEHDLELTDGVEPVHLAAYDRYASVAAGVPIEGFSVTMPPFPEGTDFATAHRDAVPDLKLLGLLNVRYLVAAFDVRGEGLIERAHFGQIRVFENPQAMPRAFVVGQVEAVRDEAEALARLAALDPRQAVLVEGGPFLTGSATFQEATVLRRSPNHIEVEVNLSAPGFLVLSEVWYPGWQASDNGEPTHIYRANGLLRGVYLEQGSHRLAFNYRPLSVQVGAAVSGSSVLALMGCLAWAAVRARRPVP